MNADVGLNLLSSNSLNYKYSLANKFFDYLHAGVPSINMNFPVYRRICQAYEVGICIDNLDKASIQYALHTLLNNPDKMQQMKNACAFAKEVYNWDNESKTMLALVSETLSG
jgi:glycosyltransferase involved in cell wall biosynthesis